MTRTEYRPNWIDRAVNFFSPRAGLQRIRYRVAMQQVQKFVYEGARSGSRTGGWISGGTDANTEIQPALHLLRNRSRDLARNNPHAAKGLSELVGHSVGTGITPRANTGDLTLDKIIDGEWLYFVENCDPGGQLDFYGMQALITRSTGESGETIVRFRPRFPQDGLRVPLQLQILESDFLDGSRTLALVDGGWIVQGVEFNQIGQRRAYWLFNNHPGSILLTDLRGGLISKPIPASEVLHAYRVLRPGQVRGVPWFAPVMMAMKDLDDYADAERVRKKIEACVVALVTQPEGGAGGLAVGIKSTDSSTGQTLESFEPGMIDYLKPGQDVKFNNPPVTQGYATYKTAELQAIGAGIDVPYEMLSGDLSQVNYSSYRAGLLSFRNTIEAYRWLTLIPMVCNPVWRRFVDTLVLVGKIKAPAYGVQWTAPMFESVDPLKDSIAELHQIRNGVLPLFEAIASHGLDPMQVLDEYQRCNAELDKRKLIFDSDPRNVNFKGVEQPADSGPATTPAQPAKSEGQPVQGKTNGVAKNAADLELALFANQTKNNRGWNSPIRSYKN